ncbi:ATP-binding protein [Aliiroseovarius crassostreae]|uniref:ATP-binding protein n=1 Tax=Aliiroseovarius crassostreae TaxID=154981 RepID=UPI003C7BF063
MIETISFEDECLEIRGFLSISSAKIELSDVTALIGAQASGKSVVAKLFYFSRRFLSSYARVVVGENFELRKFKSEQLSEFLSLFGGLDGFAGGFQIKYSVGEYELEVERVSNKTKPKLTMSKAYSSLGQRLKRAYSRYQKNIDEKGDRKRRASFYSFSTGFEEVKSFYSSVPDVLFVPASRAFYSTVSEELFTFLASDQRIDPVLAQFGSFYEFAKRRILGELYGPRTAEEMDAIKKTIRPVIRGEYTREKSREFIKTEWGKVALSSASSGQQEAFPLLLSLIEFPERTYGNQLLIIEEPEAHLFPEAQRYILQQIVSVALNETCSVLFTTHSPYVLACLNNEILRLTKEGDEETKFDAYRLGAGSASCLLDDEGLIDTNYLDAVSQKIAEDYLEYSD